MIPREPIPSGIVLIGIAVIILLGAIIWGVMVDVGAAMDAAWKNQRKMNSDPPNNVRKIGNESEIQKPGPRNSLGRKSGTK